MNIDITRIPQLAGNISRVVEISAVLVKFGIADWLGRLDSHFLSRFVKHTPLANMTGVSHEARIRLAFTELGTTFIKFGQILSTRRDLVGQALADLALAAAEQILEARGLLALQPIAGEHLLM